MKKRISKIMLFALTLILLITVVSGCRIGGYDIESKKDLNVRKERVLELLEEKYGHEFEIIGLRSGGTMGKINSFDIKAVDLPYVATASLHRELTEEESFSEAYGSHVFGEQSKEFIRNYIIDFANKKNVLFMGGRISLDDQSLFRQVPYDLDYYTFDNIYANHKELLGEGSLLLIHFASADAVEYRELNEVIFEISKLLESWEGIELVCRINVYDLSAKDTDSYKKYQENDNFTATDLNNDLLGHDFLLKSTSGSVRLYVDEIKNVKDIHNNIVYPKDNTKGE